MLNDLKILLLLLTGSVLTGCGQQESDHFNLEEAKLKWGNAGTVWTEADLQLLESGESLYRSNCSVCHARDGKGDIQLGAPDLDDSPFANGKKSQLVQRILLGKKGTAMPAFADALSDQQVAAIASYLRNAFNNQSGDSVSAEEVRRQR